MTVYNSLMNELDPDIRQFTYDRQYRIIGWKIFFETLKKVGENTTQESCELTNERQNGYGLFYPSVTVRALSYAAFHDLPNIGRDIIKMTKHKSPHNTFIRQTGLVMEGSFKDGHVPNSDTLHALRLFYSDDWRATQDIQRFHLDRFDEFVDDPENSIVDHLADRMNNTLETEDYPSIVGAFNSIQRYGDLYAGMWDKDRMLGQRILTIQLPDQPSRMLQSSARRQPGQPDRLQASA
jgi:hypothetical protein